MENPCAKKPIRILIVDDHPIVLAGLATMLTKESDFRLQGSAESGAKALAFLENHPVDVVLLDLRMPGAGGLDILPAILARKEPPHVIILSSFDYEEEIYRAANAGARGYLMKSAKRTEVVEAIRNVSCGQLHFSPAIAARIAQRRCHVGLSAREQDVLVMISKGLTNKEIGRVLHISQFTVRNHINHILEKLDASDRTEAVSIAMQQGVISVPQ
jgi:two-component system NarL family response regulator